MGDYRARDADRDRYVDVIEAAYVDGQLGEAARELRVSRALVAETLDELDGLTRDLQNRPAPAVPRATAPSAPRRAASGDSVAGKVIAIVGAIIVGVGVLAVFASVPSPEELSGDSTTVPWEQIEAARAEPGFRMTERRLRQFVTAYAAEFGTLEAYEVVLLPRRAVVHVPLRGPRQRSEHWTWDGTWSLTTGPAPVQGQPGAVDLGDLDPGRLVDNLSTAKRAVGVERGTFDRAVLARPDGGPAQVTIDVTNTFKETGSLVTTLGGDIVRRERYTS